MPVAPQCCGLGAALPAVLTLSFWDPTPWEAITGCLPTGCLPGSSPAFWCLQITAQGGNSCEFFMSSLSLLQIDFPPLCVQGGIHGWIWSVAELPELIRRDCIPCFDSVTLWGYFSPWICHCALSNDVRVSSANHSTKGSKMSMLQPSRGAQGWSKRRAAERWGNKEC